VKLGERICSGGEGAAHDFWLNVEEEKVGAVYRFLGKHLLLQGEIQGIDDGQGGSYAGDGRPGELQEEGVMLSECVEENQYAPVEVKYEEDCEKRN
jgi:hypothetical protein